MLSLLSVFLSSYSVVCVHKRSALSEDGPVGSHIWMCGPWLVSYLGRIRRCSFVGRGVSLGVDFEVSTGQAQSHTLSLPPACWPGCKLPAGLPAACCHTHSHECGLILWNCKPAPFKAALVTVSLHRNRTVTKTCGMCAEHRKFPQVSNFLLGSVVECMLFITLGWGCNLTDRELA